MTVSEKRIEQVTRIAKDNFKRHVIVSRDEVYNVRSFNVGTRDTGFYSFRVTFVPGFVHVYGDIGNVTYRPGRSDSFGWAQASRDNLDYITGKLDPHEGAKEYDEDKAREELRYYFDEDEDGTQREIFKDALTYVDSEMDLKTFIRDNIYDGWEIAGGLGMVYSCRALWGHLALVKFFELKEQEEKGKEDEVLPSIEGSE